MLPARRRKGLLCPSPAGFHLPSPALAARACVVCVLVGAWVGGGRAAAQTDASASPGVLWMGPREPARHTPSSEVGLVHVEVVVTDDGGRPVTGLPAEAFRVEEDGVDRRVETFRAVDLPGSPHGNPTRPTRPSVTSNAIDAEATPTRVFVIVFDDLHLGPAGARQARVTCERFLSEHTRPEDRVILVAPGENLVRSVATPGDRAAAAALMGSLRGRRGEESTLNDYQAFRIVEDGDSSLEARSEARRVLESARRRRQHLLGILGPVLDVLTVSRTRKSVLLVSEGFIHDPRDRLAYEVIAASQRAGAAISFVDVGRLAVPAPPPSPGESTGAEILATITGGRVVRNVDDLDDVLAGLAREASHHYILGYLPPGDGHVGRLRRIRVDVARPGAAVRARRGYWVAPDPPRSPDRDPSPGLDAPLREALGSPSLMRQIPLRLTAPVVAPTGDGRVEVAATLETNAGALGLHGTPDGSRNTTLDVVWEVRHVRGQSHAVVERRTVELPEGARVEETWLPLQRRLTLPPGLSLVKVAARDKASGALGTVALELEVPDGWGLRVSSPILSDVPADGARVPRIVARRSFPSGGVLYCYFEAFPAPGGSPVWEGDGAAYEVVDHRGEVRIRSALPLPFRGDGGGQGRLLEIPLARLEPGEYELRLNLRGDTNRGAFMLREPFSVGRPPRFDDDLYRGVLSAYLDGNFRRAVATVLPWAVEDIRAAARRLRRSEVGLKEAALLLHTDLALVLRRNGFEKDARAHLSIGRSLLEDGSSPDLHRQWLLALALEHQEGSRTADALAFYTECARSFPEAGEARLGAGTLHERIAFLPAAFSRGDLNVSPLRAARIAERSYREALRVQPSLTEARLRLARVLQLTDRADEALGELSLVVDSGPDASLKALAHLFWGEISQGRDLVDEAMEHYRVALALDGSLQVAALALAQVLHGREGRRVAVDALVPALGEERGQSPWLAYRRGPLRLSATPLREMRSRLRADAGGSR